MKNNDIASKNTRAEREAALKQRVIKLLKWTDEQWAWFQYRQGLAYLEHYIPGDQYCFDKLSASKTFWAWWRNHWCNRDESFLDCNIVHLSSDLIEQIYRELHDGRKLSGNIAPSKTVLVETFNTVEHGVDSAR